MKWYEALEWAAKRQAKVRARYWDVGVYIQLVHSELGCSIFRRQDGLEFNLTPRAMESDWEIFEKADIYQGEVEKTLTGWKELNQTSQGSIKTRETQKPSQQIQEFLESKFCIPTSTKTKTEKLYRLIGQILDDHDELISKLGEYIYSERVGKTYGPR